MIIYKATNLTNSKVYIGQTMRTLAQRRGNHYSVNEINDGSYFHNSLKKYLRDQWQWEIIYSTDSIDDLNLKEQYYIGFFKSNIREFGYNLSTGGLNCIKSAETCAKISKALTGIKRSEETRAKVREARKHQVCSDETKKKMSESKSGENHHFFGKHQSDVTKKKISDSVSGEKNFMYGKHHSPETIEKMRGPNKLKNVPKYIYYLTNPEGANYETDDLKLFCQEHHLNRSGFTACFYQKRSVDHTYKGWKISRTKKSDILITK